LLTRRVAEGPIRIATVRTALAHQQAARVADLGEARDSSWNPLECSETLSLLDAAFITEVLLQGHESFTLSAGAKEDSGAAVAGRSHVFISLRGLIGSQNRKSLLRRIAASLTQRNKPPLSVQ
jgi:hypothetical protein